MFYSHPPTQREFCFAKDELIDNETIFKEGFIIQIMVYAVYTTETFEKEASKLSSNDREIIQKIFLQLKDNPYVGDALKYRFLREKRIGEKRLYFLVYDELSAVLIVSIGGKKTQQETIDYIIRYLPEYRVYIEQAIKSG